MASAEAVRHGLTGEPERTLFYDYIEPWSTKWLRLPDGPEANEPWTFTQEQRHFLAWWYAFDEDCRWLIRRGTLRRMKGWGKDPLGAVMCCIEGFGPCRLYKEHGRWMVKRHPAAWVQIVAVSREQTRTTTRLFPSLIPESTRQRYKIEVHKEKIHIGGGRSVIEALFTSPLSAEGPRATFVLKNETQNWLSSNEGHDMDGVLTGNLAKSRDGSARALSLCNAHVPGTDSIGEREWEAYQQIEQGRSRATGVLYDSLEAPPDTILADEASLRHGLQCARGDSVWLPVDRLVGEIYDPRTPPSESRRKYLNQIVASEDAWATPQEIDRLLDPAPRPLEPGDQVGLGYDGGKSDDHCALIATRIDDGASFALGIWDPDEYHGEAPRDLIDGAVENAFGTLDVVAYYSDLEEWESYVDKWADAHRKTLCVLASVRHPIAWDMRTHQKEFTLEGAERVHDEIVEKSFAIGHVANVTRDYMNQLIQHIKNARRRPNAWGVSFGKEHRESKKKVDGLAALTLSRMARRAYLALPPNRQRRKQTGRASFL